MELKPRKEGYQVPQVEFIFREDGAFVTRNSAELFNGKKVVIFALPGAFTPTCTEHQLPGYELSYGQLTSLGIDEVYCLSVNDAFVMNAWGKELNIKDVKLLPDGNGDFTESMGYLVKKENLGFGKRSWRYAMVVDNGIIEKMFVEQGCEDNFTDDPFFESDVDRVVLYLQEN